MEKVTIPQAELDYELVIKFNVLTHKFELRGFDKDPLVALGMLEFAKHELQRTVAKNELLDEMANAPRLVGARGPLA